MKSVFKYVVVVTVFILTNSALAQTTIRFGIEAGGEEMAYADFSDGTTETIAAGSGEIIELGYAFNTPLLTSHRFSTELSLGYKSDSMSASNFEAYFDRTTFTVTQYFTERRFRFGLGVTRHFRNRFKFGNFSTNVNISHGIVVSTDYMTTNNWYFGARVIGIDYTDMGITLDANSIGFYVGASY